MYSNTWYSQWVPRVPARAALCSTWNAQLSCMCTTLRKFPTCSTMNNAHHERKKNPFIAPLWIMWVTCLCKFVWLGESHISCALRVQRLLPLISLHLKMMQKWFCNWFPSDWCTINCWQSPSSFKWIALSIPVLPFRSIDLSLRHVSTTWPSHYGCDPDARGRDQGNLHLSEELLNQAEDNNRGWRLGKKRKKTMQKICGNHRIYYSSTGVQQQSLMGI